MTPGLSDLLGRLEGYHPKPDLEVVRNAYKFAEAAHQGQTRKSGEDYFTHPVGVADIVCQLKLDEASICAALLHDVVEDTEIGLDEIAERFSPEVAHLVDGVTKLEKVTFKNKEDRQAESFRKMLVAMSRDIRVLLVKLADRLHNMRTLEHMKPEAQARIAEETAEIYAPLASRLGIHWMKAELEDLSFKYLHPEEYREVARQIDKTKRERERNISKVVTVLRDELRKHGLKADVSGRPKHLFSIWRKMAAQSLAFEEIYDLIAFRIYVDELAQCYEALGVVHATWRPVLGRFKDYIAVPKQNSYQSLHTTVVGPAGEAVEIQIRTREMHDLAEYGIAAHWKYKENGQALRPHDEARFTWLRQLMEWQQDLEDPTDFIESVKVDLFGDEIFVYTPRGDVKVLPADSTPVDFAYSIHTEVGHSCAGAKVNGAMAPLRHNLSNGDIVEIITNKGQTPNKDWLQFVKTSRARTKIRQVVRQNERERSRELGRDILEKALRKHGRSLAKLIRSGDMERAADALKCNGVDELLAMVGYGRITADRVHAKLFPDEVTEAEGDTDANGVPTRTESGFSKLLKKLTRTDRSGVRIAGLDGVLIRYAKCCTPVPGDPVIGYVTRGRGVTIHRRPCRAALDIEPERRIEVDWDRDTSTVHPVTVRVHCTDAPGLLASITQAFSAGGVNITEANCTTSEDRRAVNDFRVLVIDTSQLTGVLRSIGGISGVYSVERLNK